jgi:hypothetical protein
VIRYGYFFDMQILPMPNQRNSITYLYGLNVWQNISSSFAVSSFHEKLKISDFILNRTDKHEMPINNIRYLVFCLY